MQSLNNNSFGQFSRPAPSQQQQLYNPNPPPPAQQQQYLDEEKVYALILDLTIPTAREQALLELSKKREAYEGLAPILWHSFGLLLYEAHEKVS